jgi:hypothetical protein
MRNTSRLVLLSILQCHPTSFIHKQATGTAPACKESEPQNRTVLARNGRMYPATSYDLQTRNPLRSLLLSILQCFPTHFMCTQATGTVPACRESEMHNRAVFARNGRTYPATSYDLQTRNPLRLLLLSILQCFPTSFMCTQATCTVPACQESEP